MWTKAGSKVAAKGKAFSCMAVSAISGVGRLSLLSKIAQKKVMVADTATHGSQSCKDYLGPTFERGANVETLLKVDAALKGAACARRRKQQPLIHTSNLAWNMTASSFRLRNEQRERITKLLRGSFKDAITAVGRMEHPLQIILEVGNLIRTKSVMQAIL